MINIKKALLGKVINDKIVIDVFDSNDGAVVRKEDNKELDSKDFYFLKFDNQEEVFVISKEEALLILKDYNYSH